MNVIYALHGATTSALTLKLLGIVGFSWWWFTAPAAVYGFIAVSLVIANRRIKNGGSL